MFTCQKCLHRAIQELASDSVVTATLSRNWQSTNIPTSSSIINSRSVKNGISRTGYVQRRTAATLSALKRGHHRRVAKILLKNGKDTNDLRNKRRKAPLALTKGELSDALARASNRALRTRIDEVGEDEEENTDQKEVEELDEDIRPSQADEGAIQASKLMEKMKSKTAKAEQVELAKLKRDVEQYYRDPLQLAKAVVEKLRVPDINGALGLVRASESLQINNIVSWNHCMDWLMSQGEFKTSLKIYNEMKKRGHMPDAHTYTIMLSGLAQHAKYPQAVQEAVKIYHSMSAPNSVIKPNIIHTNAIINVCARGGDMETMWGVASKLPERGSGCPDRTTYTTILNALRENTIRKATTIADRANRRVKTEGASEERLALFKDALENGRKLWVDIGYRWRRADLIIDEQLVCAMGRLILGCGTGEDFEQVFDLVETTMNVRIPERRGRVRQSWPMEDAENADLDEEADQNLVESSDARKLPLKESSVYATPGQNTLSMLLEAALLYKQRADLGKSYWHLLTKPEGRFRVKPDAGNILSYLRFLRRTHSSHEAYQLLSRSWPDEISKALYKRSTFIIAFAACARDKNNPNVFDTARKLLDLCNEKLEEKAVGMFEESVDLGNMEFKERKKVLQQRRAEFKNMTNDELADYHRSQDGVLSLTTDPKLLRYFIDIAVDTTRGWNEGIRGLDDGQIFERNPFKNHTMIALDTISPFLPTFYELLRSKLDETEASELKKMRNQRSRRTDSRDGEQSHVGEKIEDLVALSRCVIAAYDKILVVAERFERKGMAGIDSKHQKLYDRNKRQLNAHMSRIVAAERYRLREKVAEGDKTDLDKVADEDDENSVPDIERRIRTVLEGVDGTWAGDADAKMSNETKTLSFRRQSQIPQRVGGVSRKQKAERSNLIDAGMRTQFGVQFAKNNRGAGQGLSETSKVGQRLSGKSAKRPPMIGDELGLEDEDDNDHVPTPPVIRSNTVEEQTARRYVPFDASKQHSSKSIMANEQVRNTWDKAHASASV